MFNTKAKKQLELKNRIAARKSERATKAKYLEEANSRYDWSAFNTDVSI